VKERSHFITFFNTLWERWSVNPAMQKQVIRQPAEVASERKKAGTIE
jgi:hypothetical protein